SNPVGPSTPNWRLLGKGQDGIYRYRAVRLYRAGGRAKSDTLHERRAVGAFPAADTACTAAALGGQRGALTTLPIPRSQPLPSRRMSQSRCVARTVGRSALFPAADRHAPQPRSVANAEC